MNRDRLEYDLQEQDQLCFLRIHKTGSTTLDGILIHQFGADQIYPLTANLGHDGAQAIQHYRLFRGHFDYNTYHTHVHHPVYITLLRHPVERLVSLYKHARRISEHPSSPEEQALRQAARGSLLDFVTCDHPVVRLLTINAQVRHIAGTLYEDPIGIDSISIHSPLLERAKHHLDAMVFFGLTEQFEASLLLMNFIFGWRPNLAYRTLKTSPSSQNTVAVEAEAIAAIQQRVRLDMQLYDYAKTQFDRCFQRMIETLQSCEASSLESRSVELSQDPPPVLLQWLEHHYQQRFVQRYGKSDRLSFHFNQPIYGSGWHPRTFVHPPHLSQPLYFCWTGPETVTTLDLPGITAAPACISLHVLNMAAIDVLESLTLTINQIPVPLKTTQRQGNRAMVEGSIPDSALDRAPWLRLILNVNRTIPLSQVNPARKDDRPVGLAIHRIEILPS